MVISGSRIYLRINAGSWMVDQTNRRSSGLDTILYFRNGAIDMVLCFGWRLLELSRFEIPLVELEEDLASPREINLLKISDDWYVLYLFPFRLVLLFWRIYVHEKDAGIPWHCSLELSEHEITVTEILSSCTFVSAKKSKFHSRRELEQISHRIRSPRDIFLTSPYR
ncbi:hypothetical protein Tco_0908242 [Tanacetum coccineum]|uniref:Uncharacterized protein n=1 Tax=Tanacetum coccineum TaxID=301880 RepID=A0ABQ5CNN9_9ASTR